MVRQKTRWLLLKVENDGRSGDEITSGGLFSKVDIWKAMRENLQITMGVASGLVSMDLSVRFWDPTHTRLMLVRVPREFIKPVRASLVFLTSIDQKKVALSTLSIHGSARTAKLAAIKAVRRYYRDTLLRHHDKNNVMNDPAVVRLCASMDETISILQAIDF